MHSKLLLALAAGLVAGAAQTQVQAQSWSGLPDWSGDWVLAPGKADPAPPYNAAWAARAAADAAGVKAGKLADPLSVCGLPAGVPRMFALGGVHEWIVRPGEVWHAVENGNSVQRIYTDGRPHRSEDDLFATYTGDNLGRWEGDALVIDTVGLRDDTWLDAAGRPHSDQTHVVTRLQRQGSELVARVEVQDPVAFTRPWVLERRYRKLPAGSFVHDYACKVIRTAKEAAAAD